MDLNISDAKIKIFIIFGSEKTNQRPKKFTPHHTKILALNYISIVWS